MSLEKFLKDVEGWIDTPDGEGKLLQTLDRVDAKKLIRIVREMDKQLSSNSRNICMCCFEAEACLKRCDEVADE